MLRVTAALGMPRARADYKRTSRCLLWVESGPLSMLLTAVT